jgi:hypothetical protein
VVVLRNGVADISNKQVRRQMIEQKLAKKHRRGHVFSEMMGAIRSAGAACAEPTVLLVLDAEDYQNILARHAINQIEDVRRTILGCDVFQHWSEGTVKDIADEAKLIHVPAGKAIFKAGKPVNSLYIVQSGVVKLMRRVKKSRLNETDGDHNGGNTGNLGAYGTYNTTAMSQSPPQMQQQQ